MSADISGMSLRKSAADAVTDQLRRELLDGSIAPGSRLLPKELAKRFSVSIVPVREAIRRLEVEKLIVTSPQRATFAAEVGLDDIAGVYDVRRILEVDLAVRSLKRANESDRKACQDALKVLLTCDPPSERFFEAHREFHWRLLAPGTSGVALNILKKLWQSVDRYMALAEGSSGGLFDGKYMRSFRDDHKALAKAFIQKDAKELRRLLVAHMDKNEKSLRLACEILAPRESDTN